MFSLVFCCLPIRVARAKNYARGAQRGLFQCKKKQVKKQTAGAGPFGRKRKNFEARRENTHKPRQTQKQSTQNNSFPGVGENFYKRKFLV